MIFFIIRRLILTVFLLILVSMITFAIFFLVPRLAGQTAYQLAAQYVGRNPIPSEIKAVEEKLGLNAPLYLQYGRYLKGIVFGVHYSAGTDVSYCPFPCFGYSFRNQQPVWPQLVSDRPGDALAGHRGVGALAVGGVSIGVLSALRRGSIFDRFSMGVALAGVSLPVFFTGLVALELFSYKWPIFPNVHYVPITSNPRCGRVTWSCPGSPSPSFTRRLCAADQGGNAGDHGRGLHPDRPGQGHAGTARWWSSTGCGPR